MRLFNFIIFVLFVYSATYSQQDPQFSHNMNTQLAINPGYAGSSGAVNATFLRRDQWMGFEGAPVTMVGTIDTRFRLFGLNHGAGFTWVQDEIGFEKKTNIKLSYAYILPFYYGELGIGADFGFHNSKFSNSSWNPPEGMSDFKGPGERASTFDMNLGAYYNSDDFFAGVSTTHLLNSQLKYISNEGSEANSFIRRNYYLTAGYRLLLPVPLFELTPSVFIKTDATSVQYDLNAMIQYNKKIRGGVTYRVDEGMAFFIGFELINQINISMAWDFPFTTKIIGYSKGGYEFLLNYKFDLGLDKGASSYKSIRYLE